MDTAIEGPKKLPINRRSSNCAGSAEGSDKVMGNAQTDHIGDRGMAVDLNRRRTCASLAICWGRLLRDQNQNLHFLLP